MKEETKEYDYNIFESLTREDGLKNRKYSYFGYNRDPACGFRDYIDGYKQAAEVLLEKYKKTPREETNTLDFFVYPILFIFRHTIELYIKFFTIKYSSCNDEEKRVFIKKVSHGLKKAWENARKSVKRILEKVGDSIDLTYVDKVIDNFDEFDKSSFRMRYPINKELKCVHEDAIKIKVVDVCEKAKRVFEIFETVDSRIDRAIIDNTFESGFDRSIIKVYLDAKKDIEAVCEELNRGDANIAPQEPERESAGRDLEQMVYGLKAEHAVILELLVYAGRDIESRYRLSVNRYDRYRDFMKIIECVKREIMIDFNTEVKFPAVLEKGREVIKRYLDISIKEMEAACECIDRWESEQP